MIELQLVGLHNDDDNIVLIDRDGQRFLLAIDDALRAVVRRDRPAFGQARLDTLRPKEIQTLIRQGHTPQEIAQMHDVSVENIQRYEGPVLAEREYVSQRAQALTLGVEPGAPTLGDIVVDRLANRGAALDRWDAVRDGQNPWTVIVFYTENGGQNNASWHVDLQTGHINPLDSQAKLLSQRHSESPRQSVFGGMLGFAPSALSGPSAPEPGITTESDAEVGADTETMLAELEARRGERPEPASPEFVAVEEAFDEDDVPGAHPPYSQPELASDATILAWTGPVVEQQEAADPPAAQDGDGRADVTQTPAPQAPEAPAQKTPTQVTPTPKVQAQETPVPEKLAPTKPAQEVPAQEAPERPKRRRASKRTSVPSWDEIVFGTKSEDS